MAHNNAIIYIRRRNRSSYHTRLKYERGLFSFGRFNSSLCCNNVSVILIKKRGKQNTNKQTKTRLRILPSSCDR